MSIILDIIGSTGFGAITGGLFGYLSKREERQSIKMNFEHELNMLSAKTNATLQVAKMSIEEAKVAGTLLIEKVEAQAFDTSQKSMSAVGDTIKAIIRPLILGVLMYQTYHVIQALETQTNGLESLDATELSGLYKIVVLSVTGLTATAVGWYFSTRSSKQFDKLVDKWYPVSQPKSK